MRRVAKLLKLEGLRVFYAPFDEGKFQGDDMIARFYKIYRICSQTCVYVIGSFTCINSIITVICC